MSVIVNEAAQSGTALTEDVINQLKQAVERSQEGQHDTAVAAIQREKNIKHWSREWKIELILAQNPQWRDLYDEITT